MWSGEGPLPKVSSSAQLDQKLTCDNLKPIFQNDFLVFFWRCTHQIFRAWIINCSWWGFWEVSAYFKHISCLQSSVIMYMFVYFDANQKMMDSFNCWVYKIISHILTWNIFKGVISDRDVKYWNVSLDTLYCHFSLHFI